MYLELVGKVFFFLPYTLLRPCSVLVGLFGMDCISYKSFIITLLVYIPVYLHTHKTNFVNTSGIPGPVIRILHCVHEASTVLAACRH